MTPQRDALLGFGVMMACGAVVCASIGIVRLAPPIMKEVVAATVGTITLKDMMKTVEWMVKQVSMASNV